MLVSLLCWPSLHFRRRVSNTLFWLLLCFGTSTTFPPILSIPYETTMSGNLPRYVGPTGPIPIEVLTRNCLNLAYDDPTTNSERLPPRPRDRSALEKTYARWCCGSILGIIAWTVGVFLSITVPIVVVALRNLVSLTKSQASGMPQLGGTGQHILRTWLGADIKMASQNNRHLASVAMNVTMTVTASASSSSSTIFSPIAIAGTNTTTLRSTLFSHNKLKLRISSSHHCYHFLTHTRHEFKPDPNNSDSNPITIDPSGSDLHYDLFPISSSYSNNRHPHSGHKNHLPHLSNIGHLEFTRRPLSLSGLTRSYLHQRGSPDLDTNLDLNCIHHSTANVYRHCHQDSYIPGTHLLHPYLTHYHRD